MKNWPIFLLIAIVGITFFVQQNKISNLESELLETQFITGNLAEDVVSLAVMDGNMLTKISRVEGSDTTIVETVYVPVESEVQYITTIDSVAFGELEQAQLLLAQLEQNMATTADSAAVDSLRNAITNLQRMVYVTKVEYDNSGWCLEPTVMGGLSSNLTFPYGGGARLAYIGRWGIGVQGSYDSEQEARVGVFCDYRIPKWEGLAPFGAVEYNIEREKFEGSIGIHVYFR